MQEVTWRGAAPQFLDFQSYIETYPDIAPLPFEDLQPRLQQSLSHLSLGEHFSRLLLLNTPDLPLYYQLILEMLQRLGQETVINASLCDEAQLFGAVHPNLADPLLPHCSQGALHRAHNGILLLSIAQLLDNPHWLPKIKNVLASKMLAWPSATGKQFCPTPAPLPCDVRVILFGDDLHLAELHALEPALFELSLFAHFEQEIELTRETITPYLSFIKQLQQQQQLKPLTACAVQKLLQVGARHTEAQNLAPLCPAWLSQLLEQADFYSQNNVISSDDVTHAYEKRHYCSGYLAQRALEDIHQGYVFIETSGEQIGQVNGLTVLDLPGHPTSYGEPARISCVVHYGDGEITDVERKVELGGSIHAKGVMIMHAFINSALQLTDVLPYSASIVFEQSYCEVDGDSA
ncbi:MAG: AAA family ATPase, partial [Vibrionaceae bacterium]